MFNLGHKCPGARFSKLLVILPGPLSYFVFHSRGSFKRFENYTVKLLAKETKWTSLEVRAHPTFLETLISKYDIGPIKLLELSRNRPQASYMYNVVLNKSKPILRGLKTYFVLLT